MGPSRTFGKLMAACEAGDVTQVKAVLRTRRSIVSELDSKHWSVLHCAASNRHLEVCKMLLKSGANPREVTR
jgi:ankyrin repeat protein